MTNPETEVATIKENVRHNEKAIDKLDRDLIQFRNDLKQDVNNLRDELKEEIKGIRAEISAVKKNTDNLLLKLVGTVIGSVILDVLVNKFL